MSSLFGSFSFQQSDANHAIPVEAEHGTVEEKALANERVASSRETSAEQTPTSSSIDDSTRKSPNGGGKSLGESEAEFSAPATDLHARAMAEELADGSRIPVYLDQSANFDSRSDEPSPTLASQRKMSGCGLEGKQDSFMTTEEVTLPMRSLAHAKIPETYPAYAEKFAVDPLSKDSDPSAEATPTSRSPKIHPLENLNGDDSSTKTKSYAQPIASNLNSHTTQRRIRNVHNSHYTPFSTVASADINSGTGPDTASLGSGSRTVGNSPSVNISELRGVPSPLNATFALSESDDAPHSSPSVHHARREAPKETYVADVDVDPISGRKLINQYEIIDELGRGVHGKVKLGRNLTTEEYVAIKIVDRSARRRRLGKTSNPAEKIKREIAILKKARHPNIVSLLEVIDDPAKKKVYIVLEHVEMGEIRWRTEGAREICLFECRHTQGELRGEIGDCASSNLEHAQDTDTTSMSNPLLEWKGESAFSRAQSALAKSSSDGEELSTPEYRRKDCPNEDTSPSRHINASGDRQLITSTFEEDKFASRSANDRSSEDDISRDSKRNNAHEEDLATNIKHQNSSTVHSSSRIFDTNATISASENYSVPTTNDQEIPEYFQYVPTMSLPAIREAFRDTVLGLEYLHYQGVIHRDIKPANLLQTREHRVKISDFGVSFVGRQLRESENDDTTESEAHDFDEGVELAKTVGTPAFFAPELCQTDFDVEPPPVTGQIDVWALGVTLYCLVYGRVPFFHVDTFALMRMIAHDEVYIPRKRLKAVDEMNLTHQISPNEELDSNLALPTYRDSVHESVDDDLHDLIKRLLVKDARKRITLAEVKRHPWILQDVGDPVLWVDQTDPSHQTQGKKIEVSKEDVADAVVPLNIIERVKLEFRRIGGALGLGRSSSRRRRAGSSSVVTDPISFVPDTGVLTGGTNRRSTEASLATTNTKFVDAEKRERASKRYTREDVRDPTLKEPASKGDYFAASKTSVRPSIYEQASDRRISMPAVPYRQRSSVFMANNVRPPPLTDSVKHDGVASLSAHNEPFRLSDLPASSTARSNVIGEPGRRFLRSVRSRERRSQSRLRQGDGRKRSKQELQDQSEHQRAEPSVAFSNTHAEGHVDVIPARRKGSFAAAGSQGSASPRPLSFTLTEQYSPASGNLSVSRKSSGSSQLSPQKSTDFATVDFPRQRHCFGQVARRKPSGDRYQQAQDEMIRKMVLEEARFKEAHTSASRQQKHWTGTNCMACPPSPDDNTYGVDHDQAFGEPREQISSPNSYASRWHNHYITPSSSDDQFASGVSQSTSNPSIPSVASASSSIVPEEDCKCGSKQTVTRRSSGDTLKTRPRSSRSRHSKAYASGKDPAETDVDYHVDADVDIDNDNNDEDEDDDGDDNDFIEMSRRKSTGLSYQQGSVYRSKPTAHTRPARRRLPRRDVDDGS